MSEQNERPLGDLSSHTIERANLPRIETGYEVDRDALKSLVEAKDPDEVLKNVTYDPMEIRLMLKRVEDGDSIPITSIDDAAQEIEILDIYLQELKQHLDFYKNKQH